MKRLLKILGGATLVLVLVLVGVVLSDLTFWQRMAGNPQGVADVDWYAPLERVPGSTLAEVPVADEGERTIDEAALAAALDYAGERGSVALLVYHRGRIQLEHYWPGHGRGTRTDTASMHKSVLGILVGAAVADGHIPSVDARVDQWLTEWRGDPRGDITIGQLLHMASGLEPEPFSPNPWSPAVQLFRGTDVAGTVLEARLGAEPGERFAYNSFNSQLLGLILERATGRRYADYLGERLWSRIAAGDAYVWLDDDDGLARTYCCLHTTARGWLQFGRLLLERGRHAGEEVVPESWIEAALSPSPANASYGYQIWLAGDWQRERAYSHVSPVRVLHSEPFLADDLFYLDGFGGQRLYVVPSADLVIVRTGEASMDWDDARLPNLMLSAILAEGASDGEPAAETGTGEE
jgi:hypothetical protein